MKIAIGCDPNAQEVKMELIKFIEDKGLGEVTDFGSEDPIYANTAVKVGEAVAALVGLIPNCAASVVITQLYLDGIIGPGPMMSGLLVSAGMGLLVLFKENRHRHENLIIAGLLYGVSVAWGVVIEVLGITF